MDRVGRAAPGFAAGIPARGTAAPGADGYLGDDGSFRLGGAQSFQK